MSKWRLAVLMFAALGAHDAQAAELDESLRVAAWTSSRRLDDDENLWSAQLWLRSAAALPVGDAIVRFHGEGWAEQLSGSGEHSDARVREAYAQLSVGRWEVRAGWQLFAWGRTDGINPTDNLTPRQLTLLTRDWEDQRFGTPALRASWFSGPLSLSMIWLTGFEPSELPLRKDGSNFEEVEPSQAEQQWAARVEWVSGEFEGSVSYLDGYDVLPSQVVLESVGSARVLLLHGRHRIIGADAVKTIGRFGLRAEAACLDPVPARPGAIFVKQAQWYAVVGGDRTFGEYFNVNLQYYFRHVDAPATAHGFVGAEASLAEAFAVIAQQYDHVDRGLTFRVSNQWLNETLEASVSGVFSLTRDGYLIRPVIKYRATDAWTVSVGGEILGGNDDTPYGLLEDNTAFYAELRRGF